MEKITNDNLDEWLKAYSAGNLSVEEQRAMEQYALDHPMVLDALDGYQDYPEETARIQALRNLIVAPVEPKAFRVKPMWWVAAAAAISILLAVTVLLMPNREVQHNATAQKVDEVTLMQDAAESEDEIAIVESGEIYADQDEVGQEVKESTSSVIVSSQSSKGQNVPADKDTDVGDEGSLDASTTTMFKSSPNQAEVVGQRDAPASTSAVPKSTSDITTRSSRSDDNSAAYAIAAPASKPDNRDAITVGTATKAGSSASPLATKPLVSYHDGLHCKISGRPSLSRVEADEPWSEVWRNVDQIVKASKPKVGVVTMRFDIEGKQVISRTMKNMDAVTDDKILQYLGTESGLRAKGDQPVTWLLKLEYKN